ncbi:hypothetical protein D3C85_1844740 [compost metagenome]
MCEDRLVELGFDGMKVHVLNQQHRALPDRRHRFVRGVGLVDPKADGAWVGDQPRGHEHFVRRVVTEFRLLLIIGLYGRGIA